MFLDISRRQELVSGKMGMLQKNFNFAKHSLFRVELKQIEGYNFICSSTLCLRPEPQWMKSDSPEASMSRRSCVGTAIDSCSCVWWLSPPIWVKMPSLTVVLSHLCLPSWRPRHLGAETGKMHDHKNKNVFVLLHWIWGDLLFINT